MLYSIILATLGLLACNMASARMAKGPVAAKQVKPVTPVRPVRRQTVAVVKRPARRLRHTGAARPPPSSRDDVADALVALGHGKREAQRLASQVPPDVSIQDALRALYTHHAE